MDFKSMKRKELQGLCKKHKIPANLSNLEMANKLKEIFKEKGNPSILGVIEEGQVEIASETESTNLAVNRKVKKVRFSPEHELIEFTKSSLKRSMRCLVSSGNNSLQVENVDSDKMNSEKVGVITGRVTRSRGLKLTEGKVNERKTKGQNGPEYNDRKENVSAVEKLDDGQLKESNVSKRGRKRAKDEGVSDKKALDSADEKDLVQEIVENPGRLTRSRRQKLMEASMEIDNKVIKVAKNVDEVALVSAEIDENRVVTRNSIRKRGVVCEGKLSQSVKNNGKGLESDKIAGSNVVIEPQVVLRRSKRNENRVGDPAVINGDTRQNEKVGIKGLKETMKESNEPELRRSNRRKHVTASHENQENVELKAENKRRYPTRGSVKESAVADGVSKDGKKVRQRTPATRTPIRTDFLVSINENIGTDVAVENFETGLKKNTRRSGRNASKAKNVVVVMDESNGDSFSQHKIEERKRKRKPIAIRTKPTYDFSFRVQSMKDVQCVKAAIGKVAAIPSKSYMDDSSYQDLPEIGESMHVNVQLSDGAESTSNPDLSNGKSTKNIVGDVGQDLSVADTAGRANVNLIDGNAVENLGENAASRIAELNTSPEKQRSASNTRNVEKVHSLLELIDKDVMNMVNNDHEAQVGIQAEGSSSNALIGANVSGNEDVAETSSSADSLLIGDQIDFKTALEEKEAEADNLVQLSTDAVDHVSEVEGISVQENLEIFETGQANGISLPIAFDHNDVDHLEASRIIFDNNTKDASPKSGEIERRIDYIESESALQLKEPSSGNLRRVERDSTAEGEETFLLNAVESMLAETERSAGGIPQDRRISSGETSVMAADEQGMYTDSQAVANSTEISPNGGVEVGYSPERDEAHNDKSMPSEVAETDQDGSSKVHKSNCDEDEKLSASNLFDADRMAQDGEIFSGENSVKVSDEQGIFHDSQLVEPESVGNCGKVRDEADKIDEGHEAYVFEDIQTEFAETEEGARCDEVRGSSSLREISPSQPESVFDTRGSVPIIFNTYEVHQEVVVVDTIQEKEVAGSQSHIPEDEMYVDTTISDGEQDNRADDLKSKYTYEQDKPRSQLAQPTATANTIQGHEASISASEMETNGKEEINLVVKGSDSDTDVNDAICGKEDKEDFKDAHIEDAGISVDYSVSKIGSESHTKLKFEDTDTNSIVDKEDLADVWMADVEISRNCTISKMGVESFSKLKFQDTVETENQCKNLLESHTELDVGEEINDSDSSQSWTELELNNLFGSTEDGVTPARLNDTSQGTDIENPIFTGGSCSLEKIVMEEQKGSECDLEEDQPKLLFATPTKIGVISSPECVGTIKENAVTETKSDEKVPEAGHEPDGDTNEELNEVENLELVNVSTTVISEASLEQLNDDTCECLRETNLTPKANKEEKNNSPGKSTVYPEALDIDTDAIQKNIISSSSSVNYLEKPEGCRDMLIDTDLQEDISCGSRVCLKSEGEIAQSSEGAFELSGIDFEKSNVSEKSQVRTVSYEDGNILRETPMCTYGSPLNEELANTGTFDGQKDEIDKEKRSSFCGAETDTLSSSAMCLLFGDSEDIDIEKSKGKKPVFDLEGDPEKSDEEVPEAGHEPDRDTNEELTEVENLELVDVSTRVFSEASLEKLNDDDTCDCLRETNLTPEANKEEKIICPGKSTGHPEALEIETDSVEKHIIGLSGRVKNLDELEGCRDMLIDTDLQEDISCGSRVYLKSEGEIAQSSEGAFELSGIGFEKSNVPENSQVRSVSYEDGNILRETSIFTYGDPLDEEVANTDRFDCRKDQIDKGTSPSHLSMSSHDDDVTCKDTCTNIQNEDNIVSVAEKRSSFSGAETDTLSSSAMRLLFGDSEDVDIENSKGKKTPVFNLEGDHEKSDKELHLEENVVDLNNNIHNVQNMPVSGCNETLKESDVADTIKEYIDSESSLSADVVVEGSTVDKSLVETEEWTDKKNARTILIHGTPAKVPKMADMKENAPKHKTSNVAGDFTAVRPAKRKALEDVQWR